MSFLKDDIRFQDYTPPEATPRQMKALESAIAYSKDANDFAKQIIIWTLRQTDNLTKQVALSLPENFYEWKSKDMQNGAHSMLSVNRTTHLDLIFDAIDTQMYLMHHCGRFTLIDESNVFVSNISGRTIWFAYEWYSRNVKLLQPPTINELNAIDPKDIIDPNTD